MPSLDRLLKVGKLTDSLNVYVPMMVVRHGISLPRVLLFMYLLAGTGQFGLLAVGMMIFEIGGQIVTLGSSHGLVRYVSYYEARGQLRAFFRRTTWIVLLVCTVLTAVAAVFHSQVADLLIRPSGAQSIISTAQQRTLCLLALANVLLMALYLNLLGFLYGLRVYRLVTVVEMASCILFTLLGTGVLLISPSGSAVLAAHAVSIAVALVGGGWMLHRGLSQLVGPEVQAARQARKDHDVVLDPIGDEEPAVAQVPPSERPETAHTRQIVWQVYRFGSVLLASTLLGILLRWVSFTMIHKAYGEEHSGVFFGLIKFTQPIDFLASAFFTVVFSHVARNWETDRREMACSVLESSYKAVVLGLMTLSVVLYATAQWWIRILPDSYQSAGLNVVGGQLLFFQMLANLSLLHIVARLRERTSMIALVVGVAGLLNVLLVLPVLSATVPAWRFLLEWVRWDLPAPAAVDGIAWAAWAMGLAMLVGGGTVAVVYLMRSGIRLGASTYVLFLSPVLLLLPPWATAVAWSLMLFATALTYRVLTSDQKSVVEDYGRTVKVLVEDYVRRLRGLWPGRAGK